MHSTSLLLVLLLVRSLARVTYYSWVNLYRSSCLMFDSDHLYLPLDRFPSAFFWPLSFSSLKSSRRITLPNYRIRRWWVVEKLLWISNSFDIEAVVFLVVHGIRSSSRQHHDWAPYTRVSIRRFLVVFLIVQQSKADHCATSRFTWYYFTAAQTRD